MLIVQRHQMEADQGSVQGYEISEAELKMSRDLFRQKFGGGAAGEAE